MKERDEGWVSKDFFKKPLNAMGVLLTLAGFAGMIVLFEDATLQIQQNQIMVSQQQRDPLKRIVEIGTPALLAAAAGFFIAQGKKDIAGKR